jgi:hypothetical protein
VADAVSRPLLIAEARIQFQASPFSTCGGKSDTGTGFTLSPSFQFSPVSFIAQVLHTHTIIYHRNFVMLPNDSVIK